MKKTLCVIIALILSLSLLPASALAKATTGTEAADELYRLGLFRGTGTDALGQPVYDLDKPITRLQSVVMLIRLLGEEDAALACTDAQPFSDVPEWGRQYVAYAYNKSYTKGMSATEFSPELQCTSNMYLTLVLRSLGYNDSQGDFAYESASAKAAEVGIASEGEYSDQSKTFYRDDCVLVSTDALTTPLKGSDEALVSSLVKKGAVSYDALSDDQKLLVSDPPETPSAVEIPITNGCIDLADVLPHYPAAYSVLATTSIASNPLHKNSDIAKLILQNEYCLQGYDSNLSLGMSRASIEASGGYLIATMHYILVLDRNNNVISYSQDVTKDSVTRTFYSRYISFRDSIEELDAYVAEKTKSFGSYSFEVTGFGKGWNSISGEWDDKGSCYIKAEPDIDMSELYVWRSSSRPFDLADKVELRKFVLDSFYFMKVYFGHQDGGAENYAFANGMQYGGESENYGFQIHGETNPFDAYVYTVEGDVLGYVHIDPSQYK